MKILAFDTSATVATVAVTDDLTPLAEYTVNNKNTHSETLLPMIESALAALSFIRAHAEKYGIPAEKFTTNDLHIHVPDGATPKDAVWYMETPNDTFTNDTSIIIKRTTKVYCT